jgi:peptide/nickel transport system substrate-binding protein
MSKVTPLHYSEVEYKYDVAKAKSLLKEAGFEKGFSLTSMVLAGNQDQLNILTTVQQMWAAVGVTLKIEPLDNATLNKRYRAEDFTMRTAAWTDDIADPSEIASYFANYPNVHNLHSGWQNKTVDALYTQTKGEIDPKKRAAEYADLQKAYSADAPIIFLYETPYPVAFRKNVQGFLQIPLGNNIFELAYIAK